MANLESSKKRNRQNERNRSRNRARKSLLKTETRKLMEALRANDTAKAQEQFIVVTKRTDQVAAKGTLHRKTAARRKSRLARMVNKAVASA